MYAGIVETKICLHYWQTVYELIYLNCGKNCISKVRNIIVRVDSQGEVNRCIWTSTHTLHGLIRQTLNLGSCEGPPASELHVLSFPELLENQARRHLLQFKNNTLPFLRMEPRPQLLQDSLPDGSELVIYPRSPSHQPQCRGNQPSPFSVAQTIPT